MKSKVAISFLNDHTDAKLVVAIGRIIDSMTGNLTYHAPVPTLAVVATARDSFVSAVNALDRGKDSTLRRNVARAAVVQLLRDLALHVQHTSGGDLATLASSGYPVQKGRGQPIGVLLAPQNVRLRPARNSGQMRALCDRVPAALTYQWRFATAQAPTVWTQFDPVSTASFTLLNLVPGTSYVVQARAFGTKGPSDWSGSATLMAA